MKKILIPVDGSENSLHAVRYVARQYFTEPNLNVHLVHVCVPLSSYVARFVDSKSRARYHEQNSKAAVAAAQKILSAHSVPHSIHVRFGETVSMIAATAEELRVGQIVMGTARKNMLVRLVQDSVSARITERVDIPVQLVTGKNVPGWERIGIPAVVSAAFAALVLAAAD